MALVLGRLGFGFTRVALGLRFRVQGRVALGTHKLDFSWLSQEYVGMRGNISLLWFGVLWGLGRVRAPSLRRV